MERAPRVHWADGMAQKIIRQRGEKDSYVLASGISPSGQVHVGNFREVITVDLVVRALADRGKEARFLFSWDDFDSFRKIPAGLPHPQKMEAFLHRPLVDVPDPYGKEASYAQGREKAFEAELARVGVAISPLYQGQKYRDGEYGQQIHRALECRREIRAILNRHRVEALGEDYLPVAIYCVQCGRDDGTTEKTWDGQCVHYRCIHCGLSGRENPHQSKCLKLPWRVDWPMRWAFEGVDFEPGGKDHSSEGGSYTTAREIVGLFGGSPPVYLQYDFVGIKGAGGKMSSSLGNLVTLSDVLALFEPEIVRWFFVCQRPNVDFSLSFGEDVIKAYESYDRMERLAWGLDKGNPKKRDLAKRIVELSQLDREGWPVRPPFRASFRHLTNILQIHGGDVDRTVGDYGEHIRDEHDENALRGRVYCALHWLEHHAPDRFKFRVNEAPPSRVPKDIGSLFLAVRDYMASRPKGRLDPRELHEHIYEHIHALGLKPADAFKALYQALISKDQGPKLAEFMANLDRDRLLNLLSLGRDEP